MSVVDCVAGAIEICELPFAMFFLHSNDSVGYVLPSDLSLKQCTYVKY